MELNFIAIIVFFVLILNTFAALLTVFIKQRSISSTLAWIIALLFFPVGGFILYQFFGRGIDADVIRAYGHAKSQNKKRIKEKILKNNKFFIKREPHVPVIELLNKYFSSNDQFSATRGNDIYFYTDGKKKFDKLFEDLRAAKSSIHVEYYSFFNDDIGKKFLDILTAKAKEGVEVRVVYDQWGSPNTNKKFFKPLVDVGGNVAKFVTSKNLISKTRLNYHLHRKIVVIDGEIGWMGGFNVGDQYLGDGDKFGYWRDTHARILGAAVINMQEVFVNDWNASAANKKNLIDYNVRYFKLTKLKTDKNIHIQIVSDGPENETQVLKGGFIRMILAAKKSIWIQTPYLVPDESIFEALEIAIKSGVDVRIMIPSKPDHPFIYRATQYYANKLHKIGAKIYIYNNGFLHSKTMSMDDDIFTFGTTNQDIRSYALNFEINAFIYDNKITKEMKDIFKKDMEESTLLTDEILNKQSRWLRFKQNFSRLFSPIL